MSPAGRCSRALATLLLSLGPVVALPSDNDCLVCHASRDLAVVESDGQVRSMFVEPARYAGSVHAKGGCLSCHGGFGAGPHGEVAAPPATAPWAAMLAGRSAAERAAVQACVRCHPQPAAEYAGSIHATSAAAGNRDTPLCHDCHGNHYTTPHDDLESAANPQNVPATCGKCHADALVMAQYNVTTNVVQTFDSSFHGEKQRLGDAAAAVCTSCHGVHAIRAPADPQSSVNPANVATTCGACHKSATPAFAASFQHRVPDGATAPLVYWVAVLYQLAIAGTIGGMLAYLVLDIVRRRRGTAGGHA